MRVPSVLSTTGSWRRLPTGHHRGIRTATTVVIPRTLIDRQGDNGAHTSSHMWRRVTLFRTQGVDTRPEVTKYFRDMKLVALPGGVTPAEPREPRIFASELPPITSAHSRLQIAMPSRLSRCNSVLLSR